MVDNKDKTNTGLKLILLQKLKNSRIWILFLLFIVFLGAIKIASLRMEQLFLEKKSWELAMEYHQLDQRLKVLCARISYLKSPARIEVYAKNELGMIPTEPKALYVVLDKFPLSEKRVKMAKNKRYGLIFETKVEAEEFRQ